MLTLQNTSNSYHLLSKMNADLNPLKSLPEYPHLDSLGVRDSVERGGELCDGKNGSSGSCSRFF